MRSALWVALEYLLFVHLKEGYTSCHSNDAINFGRHDEREEVGFMPINGGLTSCTIPVHKYFLL